MRRGLELKKSSSAFTIIEVMIDITIIALVAAAVLTAFSASFKGMALAKAKIAAVAIANTTMEELRNMPYDNLATEHGLIYPPGNIADDKEVVQRGVRFNVHTVITYVDDPFDGDAGGTIAGKPQDIYPYDYKKAEVTVSKIGMNGYLSRLTSNFSAKAAETPSNSGILKICVIDANSAPIVGATVTIQNTEVTPAVDMTGVTGSDGCIMVPNLPEDLHNHYHITATKAGYSFDSTYPRTAQNPNSLYPDVNVLAQQVTNQTLIIDKFSDMEVTVVDTGGVPVAGGAIHVTSVKEKYFNPSTPKVDLDATLDANGYKKFEDIEFNDYNIAVDGWYVVATSPYQSVKLGADTTLAVVVTVSSASNFPAITNISPLAGTTGLPLSLTITGSNFGSSPTVKIVSGAGSEINGTNIDVNAGQTIDADFDLDGAATGLWNLVVTVGTDSVVQQKAIEIK